MHWDTLDLDLTLPELAVSWEPLWALASLPQPSQVWEAVHPHRHGSLQSDSMSLHARPSGLVRALCRGRGSIRGKKELWEAWTLQGKPELISHFRFLLGVLQGPSHHLPFLFLAEAHLSAWRARHSLALPLLWVPLKGCLCKYTWLMGSGWESWEARMCGPCP